MPATKQFIGRARHSCAPLRPGSKRRARSDAPYPDLIMAGPINWFSQVGSITKFGLLSIPQRRGAVAATSSASPASWRCSSACCPSPRASGRP